MGNPNKDKSKEQDGEATTESITSTQDAHHTNRDLTWEREAWDMALSKTIAKAVAREMAKAHAHYQALLNEKSAAAMPKIMDPFDWSKDKAIYQRWQL